MGKSTIAGMIRKRHAISAVSTDSLSAVLDGVWCDETAPDFFVMDRFRDLSPTAKERAIADDFAEPLKYLIEQDTVVWKAAVAFAKREHEEGRDILIEGTGIIPELVNQLDALPHRVVFVGNQAENHSESIRRSARDNPNDWMRRATDQYIDLFARFVMRMSVYIEQEARKHDFEYIETGNRSLEDAADLVVKSLGIIDGGGS